jgi:hypothetical protein
MVAAAMVTALLVGPSVMADAQEPEPSVRYETPVVGKNAAASCRASDDVVIFTLYIPGDPEIIVDQFPLSEPGDLTRGACVSTITNQELTTAAYVANCKVLEGFFAAESATGKPYPYSFYGNPEYTAKNRADCVSFLRGFHTGTLPPGPGS